MRPMRMPRRRGSDPATDWPPTAPGARSGPHNDTPDGTALRPHPSPWRIRAGQIPDAGGPLPWTPGAWDPYGDLMFVRGTTIGDDGSFVLTDLPPGRVTLSFPGERRVVVDGLKAGETREGVQGPPPK